MGRAAFMLDECPPSPLGSEHAHEYSEAARVADKFLTPVAVLAPDGTIRYANEATRLRMDDTAVDLVGLQMFAHVHPADRE